MGIKQKVMIFISMRVGVRDKKLFFLLNIYIVVVKFKRIVLAGRHNPSSFGATGKHQILKEFNCAE